MNYEQLYDEITSAPSSGAYCEEARADALRQLQELNDATALSDLHDFWVDDYRAAVIDDNFVRKHAFDDAYDDLWKTLQTLKSQLDEPAYKTYLERVAHLRADAERDFLSTQAPSFFDPQEHWRQKALVIRNEISISHG